VLTPATEVKVTSLAGVFVQVITDLNSSGYVVPQSKAAVASKGTGRLIALEVREGSRVKQGISWPGWNPTTFRLDVHQTRSQLAAGRATLAQSQSNWILPRELDRYKTWLSSSWWPKPMRPGPRRWPKPGRGGIGTGQYQGAGSQPLSVLRYCLNSC